MYVCMYIKTLQAYSAYNPLRCPKEDLSCTCTINCAVPENIHTTPTEGIGISWGEGGGFCKAKKIKELYEA